MPIVPANEAAYRDKIRRRLTLDLFTRYGTFWDAIAELRDTWEISPSTAVPPVPTFYAESVRLMSRYQMAERFHMPDRNALASDHEAELRRVHHEYGFDGIDEEIRALRAKDRRISVGLFLNSLHEIWKAEIARPNEKDGDWRNGGNVTGWMSWLPFPDHSAGAIRTSQCPLSHPAAESEGIISEQHGGIGYWIPSIHSSQYSFVDVIWRRATSSFTRFAKKTQCVISLSHQQHQPGPTPWRSAD